jgi:hypothetical protein
MKTNHEYPISLTIDYPKRPLDKVSTFFRIFTVIPILIILGLLQAGGSEIQSSLAGFVILPTLLMLLFCQKYPKWWFDWNFNLAGFAARVTAYFALLSDVYPSTDEEQYVHLQFPYPNAKTDLNRWMPLVKWFLAIPHYIVLAVLSIIVLIVVIISWFAILFTGRIPRNLFEFIVGVFRWYLRVAGYALLLTTDQYPPFSLAE